MSHMKKFKLYGQVVGGWEGCFLLAAAQEPLPHSSPLELQAYFLQHGLVLSAGLRVCTLVYYLVQGQRQKNLANV